jgi:hypothetical protein
LPAIAGVATGAAVAAGRASGCLQGGVCRHRRH